MIEQKQKIQKMLQKIMAGLTYRQRVIKEMRKRYSIEDEIALINNYNLYLADESLVEYKNRYDEYQTYRASCKEKIKDET